VNVKAHPNENFSRELMELYTLGHGNYTEEDVRQSARAFTGWTLRRPRMGGGFVDNVAQHDDGAKTFLGRTGVFNGADIINIIFEQPAAPRWFAYKLLTNFVYSDPEPELIDGVAALIKRHDFELAPVMSALLRSNVFYSTRAYRALVKSPIEYVIGTHQLYGVRELPVETLGALYRMDQVPFHPPNVKGWGSGAYWLNSQTVLARENFANAIVNAGGSMAADSWLTAGGPGDPVQTAHRLIAAIVQGDASPASLAKLQAYLAGAGVSANARLSPENYPERIRGAAYLTMAMPAYQLS
ncbi:MAG: DUF1800 family protein, partial [Vulcanimicrobiaceae bacterium]